MDGCCGVVLGFFRSIFEDASPKFMLLVLERVLGYLVPLVDRIAAQETI